MSERRITREVSVGSIIIGGENPIVIQSMTATRTQDIPATINIVNNLEAAGASIVRIAVDSVQDALALEQIRDNTSANLSVDLQENYRLAAKVAPFVDKIRYNPGHLYHHEKTKPIQDKVARIVEIATRYGCSLRIGVNCGSVDPELAQKFGGDSTAAMVESALMHSDILDHVGFTSYLVSLKDSDPIKVVKANMEFARLRPDIPLHLGVTEAGLPLRGIKKTRFALGQLLSLGIGETLRVSLTVPAEKKSQEIEVGRKIVEDVEMGKFPNNHDVLSSGLDIISCPSCSRVENSKFVELAERIQEVTEYANQHNITVAVMGCRVNGPGETDHADLGLWCGPNFVNLKRKDQLIGAFTYQEIVAHFLKELDQLISNKGLTI